MNNGCQAEVCEGLCTGEAARQCYLRTLGEMDQTKARILQLAQIETVRLNKLRNEANAALSNWLCNRDQVTAAEIQKILNTWPCERAADRRMSPLTCGAGREISTVTTVTRS